MDSNDFNTALERRILILDGSMGVEIQHLGLTEAQFRGSRLADHGVNLSGNNDILVLTRPEAVSAIHRAYLEAGADIIETDTFNATVLSQAAYGTAHLVGEINREGARLARREADRMMQTDRSRPRFVAGSIGPTGCAASLSADVNDPAARQVTYGELYDAFLEQAAALIDGGVDMLLVETVFDALSCKAAVAACRDAITRHGADMPLLVSMTVSDRSGRILSGHTPEALAATIAFGRPAAVGFNCSAGPTHLMKHVAGFAGVSPWPVIFYPNAGLPDSAGNYPESSAAFAGSLGEAMADSLVNIAGGCCGTTPAHIAAVARKGALMRPHVAGRGNLPWLAGLDGLYDDRGFINVGERCNVAGSRKFLRLIKEKNYDEAVEIARRQVADGAMVLDINLDDGLLDTRAEMEHFVRLLASEPDVAAVPWMIDSSDFDVLETALCNVPGKPVVNSISLKHGEAEFLDQARRIARYGAAVVVMAFDEIGQATTFEHKTAICARAYRLLTEQVGMDPRDIIFDPNVLTIATGMPEHDRYALDFIEAVRWIHANLPGAKTSGGVSNLSFAFRGNNYLRQAMHAVFLYHAVAAGLTMAIVDPATRVRYDDIPPELLELLEDAILCRRPDAADRLIEAAPRFGAQPGGTAPEPGTEAGYLTAVERVGRSLVDGDTAALEAVLDEAVAELGSATAVVSGPLMQAMEHVGDLFGSGRMFLPQVVKSARVMHRAVALLGPCLEASAAVTAAKGRWLLATVKGDVHDIGKNIVGVVLRCNNFEVVDLGVQVDADALLEAVRLHNPDFIGLSGLISPSLREMAVAAARLSRAGIAVPLFVGGAATSALHTAMHIAPAYAGPVVHVTDAAQNPVVASRFMADMAGETQAQSSRHAAVLGRQAGKADDAAGCTCGCAGGRPVTDWSVAEIDAPRRSEFDAEAVPVSEVRRYINWTYFCSCWKVRPDSPQAQELLADASQLLDRLEAAGATMRCRVRIYEAHSVDGGIVVGGRMIATPRQRPLPGRAQCLSLSDFVAPEGYGDHVGCFMVTVGDTIRRHLAGAVGDDYSRLLMQSVADRLAEAASEWLHRQVRVDVWGYAPDEPDDTDMIRRGHYRGIRPAVGYPSLPDQMLMHELAALIDARSLGVGVTVNGALDPAPSVAGFYLASPRARYFTL